MSTVRIEKVIALVIGDSYRTGGSAAISLAQNYKHLEVVIVDNSSFYLGQAHRAVSQFGRCSIVNADISKEEGLQKVLNIIEDPRIWVQYLVNTNVDFDLNSNDPQQIAENKGVYKITRASLKNMIHNRNGRIENPNTTTKVAYNITDYKPDTKLPHHVHHDGEIIYVLEGVYSDENGHSHQGEYLRNPAKSEHTPFTLEGSLILVVHKNIPENDQSIVRFNIKEQLWSNHENTEQIKVHEYQNEKVYFIKYDNDNNFKPWLYDNGGEMAYIPNNNDDRQIVLCQSENLPF